MTAFSRDRVPTAAVRGSLGLRRLQRGNAIVFRDTAPRAFNSRMDDREEFLEWFNTTWRAAERALHDGDAGPRSQTWSERPPVTLFGAWLNADGPDGVRDVFQKLADGFSQSRSSDIDLVAADADANFAYTVHREITSTSVNGEPRDYVLRVTQVYRREDGRWKVIHRHGDEDPTPDPEQ
jgi:ketosteroid isomerase-like protein